MVHDTQTFVELNDLPVNNKPRWVIMHHTGGTDINPLADTSHHTAEDVEQWHLSKGWDGIGYHYFIEKDGDVWRGRPEHRNGAHCIGKNTESIGICLAGNFDATMPTQAQTSSLRQLLIDIKQKYNIPVKNIVPHRKFANKTCYGRRLADDWAQQLVHAEMTLGEYTTLELLKEAMSRKDIHRAITRYFTGR